MRLLRGDATPAAVLACTRWALALALALVHRVLRLLRGDGSPASLRPRVITAVVLALALAVVEFAVGGIHGSKALIADSLHVLDDMLLHFGVLCVLLRVIRGRPAGRVDVIFARLAGVLLVAFGVWNGIDAATSLGDGEPPAALALIGVSAVAMVVNLLSLQLMYYADSAIGHAAHDDNMSDLLGSALGLVAGVATWVAATWFAATSLWDGLAAIGMGALMIVAGVRILRPDREQHASPPGRHTVALGSSPARQTPRGSEKGPRTMKVLAKLPPGKQLLNLFLLGLVAALVLGQFYGALMLGPELAPMVGLSTRETAVLASLLTAAALYLVRPLGAYVGRRGLCVTTLGILGVAALVAPHLTPRAALVALIITGLVAIMPWLSFELLADHDEVWHRPWFVGLWWFLAFGVMAVGLALGSATLIDQETRSLDLLLRLWGIALLAGAGVAFWRLPKERRQRQERLIDPWLHQFTKARGTVLGITALASFMVGFDIAPYDAFNRPAMDAAGVVFGAAIASTLLIGLGVLPGLFMRWLHPVPRWLRIAAAATAAGAIVGMLAGLLEWHEGFWISRALVETGTSTTTVVTQLDPRTAALAQIFKSLGQFAGTLAGDRAWVFGGWPGVCLMIALSALIVVFFRQRASRDAAIAQFLWRRAAELDGQAVIEYLLLASHELLTGMKLDAARAWVARAHDIDPEVLADADDAQLTLTHAFASCGDVRVRWEDGAVVLQRGRVTVTIGAGGALTRTGRSPRHNAADARLMGAAWRPVSPRGAELQDDLNAEDDARFSEPLTGAFVAPLVAANATAKDDLVPKADPAARVYADCTPQQLAALRLTGATPITEDYVPWLPARLGHRTVVVLPDGRIPNAAAQQHASPRPTRRSRRRRTTVRT